MTLIEKVERYHPVNEQEKQDKEVFLKCLASFDDTLKRDNTIVHFSSSALVVNPDRTRILVVYHNIYNGWICPGGHADGEEDLLSVAVREVEEETGQAAKVLSEDMFSIQVFPVAGHIKRGKYVSTHIHLDVVYLLEADDHTQLTYREDESGGVKWIPLSEAADEAIVDFARPIHEKLLNKLVTANM